MRKWSLSVVAVLASTCAAPESASSPAARLVEGRFVWGAEVETFRPCGDSLTYWVVASDSMRLHLRSTHGSLTSRPYQAIFLRVHGERTDGERGEFAREYDGLFRIDSVLTADVSVPATCEDAARSPSPPRTTRTAAAALP